MDKYEYKLKTEQMLELMENGAYNKAAEVADTIDWKKIKNATILTKVSDIYEKNGDYQKSYEILNIAYHRAEGSRKVLYRLCALAIKTGNVDEAIDYYDDFMQVAPKDPNQHILKYKILSARKAPIDEQIEALEEFKKAEYIEEWAYELALLYQKAGMTAECLEECDDLILWFSEGKYVFKAMELKMQYKPLTPSQQEKYDHRYEKIESETEEIPDITEYQIKKAMKDKELEWRKADSTYEEKEPEAVWGMNEEMHVLKGRDDSEASKVSDATEEFELPEILEESITPDAEEELEMPDAEVEFEVPDVSEGSEVPDISEEPEAVDEAVLKLEEKGIGKSMRLEDALKSLLQPKPVQYENMADDLEEMSELEEAIEEIESVADLELVNEITGKPESNRIHFDSDLEELKAEPLLEEAASKETRLPRETEPLEMAAEETELREASGEMENIQAAPEAGADEASVAEARNNGIFEENSQEPYLDSREEGICMGEQGDFEDVSDELLEGLNAKPSAEIENSDSSTYKEDEDKVDFLHEDDEFRDITEEALGELTSIESEGQNENAEVLQGEESEGLEEGTVELLEEESEELEEGTVELLEEDSEELEEGAGEFLEEESAATEAVTDIALEESLVDASNESDYVKDSAAESKAEVYFEEKGIEDAESAENIKPEGMKPADGQIDGQLSIEELLMGIEESAEEVEMEENKKKTEPILPPDIQRLIDEIEGVLPEETGPEDVHPVRSRTVDEPHTGIGDITQRLKTDDIAEFLLEKEQHEDGLDKFSDNPEGAQSKTGKGNRQKNLYTDATEDYKENYADEYEDNENADVYEDDETADEYDDEEYAEEYENDETADEYEDDEYEDEYEDDETADEYEDEEYEDEYEDGETADEYDDEEYADEYDDEEYTDEYEDDETADEYDDEEYTDEYEDDETTDEYEDGETADEYDDEEYAEEYEDDETADEYDDEEYEEYDDEEYDAVNSYEEEDYGVIEASFEEEFRPNPEHAEEPDDREIPDDDNGIDILSATTPLSRKETAKLIATGKTAPLPLDEISDALSMSDTGFVVHGRYDLAAQSGIGTRAGLTEEQKKLFSYFVPVRGMSEQLVDVLEQDINCTNRGGTSRTGNLLIIGSKGNGKTVLAVDVVKAIQKQRNIHQGKVAIVTGDSLNKKKISDIFDKLCGGALIIEKAAKMNEKTVARLNKAMERNTGEMMVVLEEQRKPLDRLLSSNREFRRKFTSRLEVPIFINDELVTFGQTYAQENGYRIDEMGILALYSRIDALQREDHAVAVAEVKEVMDEAMEHSQKASAKKLVKRVFGKNTDDADRIILSEKDFNI